MDFLSREAFVLFIILLGGAFFVAAIITEGPVVGKFKKNFCFIFGIVMMGLGIYLKGI